VRRRVAARIAALKPRAERAALEWIESSSEFDER
jgi:hypothetical protein